MLFPPLAQYLIYGTHLYSLSLPVKRVQVIAPAHSEEDRQLLGRIFRACKVSRSEWFLSRVGDALQSPIVLFFGLEKEDLLFYAMNDAPYFTEQKKDNQCLMCAPSLAVFHNNQEQKKLLWQALQPLFSLK